MAVMVYKYGTHSRTRLPEEALAQLRLAHRMRNALVEAHLGHEQQIKDLWSGYPQVADIEVDLETAETEATRLIEQARSEHSKDRTVATRTTTAAALREARAQVKALKAARREAIGEAYLILKPQLEAAKAAHKELLKAIRQDYAAQGLYWGTYNAVLDDHHTAVKRITANRKAGQAAALRYKRWRGEGTLTVQLQRAAADPVRSPATIASGGMEKWRNVFRLSGVDANPTAVASMTDAERKRSGADRGTMLFSLGAGRTAVEIPITVHRPLPPNADITGVQLTMRRIASREEISVAVTVKVPDPDPPQGLPPVALHVGWRQRGDGSIRVGTWASTVPLAMPVHLSDVVITHDGGRWGEIVMPAGWLDRAGKPAALRGQRDVAMAPVQGKLASWLDDHPQPGEDDGPELNGAVVRKWRSAGHFAALALRWRDTPPPGGGEIAALLEAWRRQDKHLWNWEANLRRKLAARRDDAWRRVGAALTSQAGLLVVDDANLAQMRRRPDAADDDPVLPGTVQQQAHARAALSAPGRLRELVRGAALRRGVPVREVPAAHLSRTCQRCGTVADAHPRYATSATVACPACDHTYDQDRSAVVLMLARECSSDEDKQR